MGEKPGQRAIVSNIRNNCSLTHIKTPALETNDENNITTLPGDRPGS